MLTIEDAWKFALPEGTELAAGARGIWHQVSWVARLLPRPPGFEGIKGGELALVSAHSMRLLDERLTLTELMLRLSEKHVAGVAVVGDLPHEAVAFADQHAIPLFDLPENTNLLEVEQAVLHLIVERRTELYQRGQEIFMQLAELAIDGKGVPAILHKIAAITGNAVALEDENFNLQHLVTGPVGLLDQDVGRRLLEATRRELSTWSQVVSPNSSEPPINKIESPGSGLVRLVAPVSVKDKIWGFVSVIGTRESLSEADRIAVARGAAACTIEIGRDRAVLEAQDRLRTNFVDDLLTGDFPNPEAITGRAKRLGYNLAPPYVVLAISAIRQSANQPKGEQLGHHEGLLDGLEREITETKGSHLCTVKDSTLFLLVPTNVDSDTARLKTIGDQIKSKIKTQCKEADVAIGIGRVRPGLDAVKLSYQEARQALGMGTRLFGKDCLVFFGDLGVYRLLFSLHGTSDLQGFYEETLGVLLEYDKKNGGELVKTLQTYFAACGSLTEAAQRLHLHRNTLLYRLHRVREIAGIDLDDPETRLALQLALRIGETLQAAASTRGV